MNKQRVIIIGSGLGGLSTGVVLAKNGYGVLVLEQGTQAGGCLQCFARGGVRFETGMHFVGSAAPGQTLDRLMRYLELTGDVRLAPLDPTGYDIIGLGGEQYRFANGREAFIRELASRFPAQRDNLERYFDLIEQIAAASSLHSLRHAESDAALGTEYQLRAVDEVVGNLITDPLLARVLVGNLPLYAGERGRTPFATHAFIMDFYNQSAYRFVGGSDTVARSLVHTIRRYGGEVLTRKQVTRITCDDHHATGVLTADGTCYEADLIISDTHPKTTLSLLGDTHLIRPAFRRRIEAIDETTGCFSVYLKFREGAVPYMNANYYGYATDTPWDCERYDERSWPKGFLYMHFCDEPSPQFARTGVVLSYMRFADVARWQGTSVGRRGQDYEDFKHSRAERLLASLEQHFPGIRRHIDGYWTSTPLTYLDYTGTARGSMYGIAKDVHAGAAGRVPHRTRVPNVLQTGQNINSHGMLGVLVGTIVTCSELLTANTIYQQIKEANT